jgi:hypothetical protein
MVPSPNVEKAALKTPGFPVPESSEKTVHGAIESIRQAREFVKVYIFMLEGPK